MRSCTSGTALPVWFSRRYSAHRKISASTRFSLPFLATSCTVRIPFSLSPWIPIMKPSIRICQGKAADDVIVQPLHQARVHVVGLQFAECGCAVAARRWRLSANRATPSSPPSNSWNGGRTRSPRRTWRAVSFGFFFSRASASAMALAISSRNALLGLRRGVQLGAPEKGIAARYQFAFERTVAVHFAEDERLRQVIVQVGSDRVLRNGHSRNTAIA